ncbi:ankyrin repeat-containing domain protein [Aspergillus avenaceus]|uniref:Ankyrin repeat-containing domain protein n=1 Tax=Aspergillus avenaceus TaxID=36643 RepID=A0A5N6TUE9_ASPAV|nr:ankyrin repeat-containing domain protein [Aspergillus avenaceus]
MRLLSTEETECGGFIIHDFFSREKPEYAVLSHTWENEEMTFQEIVTGRAVDKQGFRKIKDCCARARLENIQYIWIDTCCIDKTSSAELSEAINSMYRWYEEAKICYVFLFDIGPSSHLDTSRWFTRGWTLQELLAPPFVKLFDDRWNVLGTKDSLRSLISKTTNIPVNILSGEEDLDRISIAQRLSWAAGRVTTRVEDRAYSLLGIFGINMPLIYGEGKRSFIRLQEEILKVYDDTSIFAWKSHEDQDGLLATSPDAFEHSSNIVLSHSPTPLVPLAQSNKGIHLELQMIGKSPGLALGVLNCLDRSTNCRVGIYLKDLYMTLKQFERVSYTELPLVDLKKHKRAEYPRRRICIRQTRRAKARPNRDRIPERQQPGPKTEGNYKINGKSPTLALYAAKGHDIGTLWMLLIRGDIKADVEDAHGRTPLSYVSEHGHEALLRLLLAQSQVNYDSRDKAHRTPLSFAASAGHETIVDLLIETGEVDIESKDEDELTALAWASRNGHCAVVELLLMVVEALVSREANVEARDEYGWTALLYSARYGHVSAVQTLLARGANIESMDPDDGWTALICAAENGHEAVVQELLLQGANIESRDNHYGWTALGWAAGNGHASVVQQLLARKAYVESQDYYYNRTPLSWAAANGHDIVVRQLLQHGADSESKDNHEGRTPLSWAATNGHEAVVRELLERDANIESRSQQGHTAMFYASRNGFPEVVELLQSVSK